MPGRGAGRGGVAGAEDEDELLKAVPSRSSALFHRRQRRLSGREIAERNIMAVRVSEAVRCRRESAQNPVILPDAIR